MFFGRLPFLLLTVSCLAPVHSVRAEESTREDAEAHLVDFLAHLDDLESGYCVLVRSAGTAVGGAEEEVGDFDNWYVFARNGSKFSYVCIGHDGESGGISVWEQMLQIGGTRHFRRSVDGTASGMNISEPVNLPPKQSRIQQALLMSDPQYLTICYGSAIMSGRKGGDEATLILNNYDLVESSMGLDVLKTTWSKERGLGVKCRLEIEFSKKFDWFPSRVVWKMPKNNGAVEWCSFSEIVMEWREQATIQDGKAKKVWFPAFVERVDETGKDSFTDRAFAFSWEKLKSTPKVKETAFDWRDEVLGNRTPDWLEDFASFKETMSGR